MRSGRESPTDTQQSKLVIVIRDKTNNSDGTLTQVITPEGKPRKRITTLQGLEVHFPAHSTILIVPRLRV